MVKCRSTYTKVISHQWNSGVKWLFFIAIVLFATGAMSMAADTTPAQMSDELRSMVLNLDPNDIGVTQENFPHAVVALVMETGFPDGFFILPAGETGDCGGRLQFWLGIGYLGGRHCRFFDRSWCIHESHSSMDAGNIP